jgi:cytidyltransferase-like protein
VKHVVVSGSFDDLRSPQVRFLQEAARLGLVEVMLWSDEVVTNLEGKGPKFPWNERQYLLQAIRYVDRVTRYDRPADPDALPLSGGGLPAAWIVGEAGDSTAKQIFCRAHGIAYCVLRKENLLGFPVDPPAATEAPSGQKKVIVTGCYDWFHSGHVRFFEEVAALGDLYVAIGHDANIKLLKGDGHPLFPEQERRFMVQSIRWVKQALVTSGEGWLDAEPEIGRIRPDIYAVNEDGDRPEKRSYCEAQGIEYRVLKRIPKEGLPQRESTNLRGF